MATTANPSILCAIDFSDSSLQALMWAIPEAQKHNYHISVLYPYRLDQIRKKEDVVKSKKEMDVDAVEKFDRLVSGMLRDGQVSFNFKSEVGFLRDRIREHANKNNVVMLVMGKELAGEESFQELIEEVEVPIVIVPAKKRRN